MDTAVGLIDVVGSDWRVKGFGGVGWWGWWGGGSGKYKYEVDGWFPLSFEASVYLFSSSFVIDGCGREVRDVAEQGTAGWAWLAWLVRLLFC